MVCWLFGVAGANRHSISGRRVSARHQCTRAVSSCSASSALRHQDFPSQCPLQGSSSLKPFFPPVLRSVLPWFSFFRLLYSIDLIFSNSIHNRLRIIAFLWLERSISWTSVLKSVGIWQTGEICLDILKTAWSPAWTLQSVCRAVIALLAHPEADSPLNCDAGVWQMTLILDMKQWSCM